MSQVHYKLRLFLFADIEKEEAWINQQRSKNLYLDKMPIGSIFYRFREAEDSFVPVTRIDFQEFENPEFYEDYIALYEDDGWQHVYGSRSHGLHYFRQDNEAGYSDLYSDKSSRAQLYLRYCKYLATLFICFLPIIINAELLDVFKKGTFRSAYLTPDLWDMTGIEFWSAFAFETPFALFRILGSWLLAFLIITFFIGAVVNWYRYKKLEPEEV